MKIAVLGAFGMMGEACLHDLAGSEGVTEVLAADVRLDRAEAVLAGTRGRAKVRPVQLDFRDRPKALRVLAGSDALVNCAWYELNLDAMDLALGIRSHYVDLGGLYHMTLKQLAKDAAFRAAGRLAVLGCGSTPGITNMMAQAMTLDLDRVETLIVYDASHDPTIDEEHFLPPFSVRTMMDELEQAAPVFTKGRMRMLPPFSCEETLSFKPPIGRCNASAIIHSEQATIPTYLKAKGLKEHTFKIVYPEAIGRQLQVLMRAGFASTEPVAVNGTAVSPRDFLSALSLKNWSGVKAAPADFEILRLVVRGRKAGRPVRRTWDCEIRHTRRLTGGAMGVGFTGSIAAQMAATGRTLRTAGAAAPETALPCGPFFDELLDRRVFRIVAGGRPVGRLDLMGTIQPEATS